MSPADGLTAGLLPLAPTTSAVAGAAVGLMLLRPLRRGAHRASTELDLPVPGYAWLPPAVALAFAGVTASAGMRGQLPATAAYLVATAALAWLVAVDLDVRRLPNAVTLPAVPVSALTLGALSLTARDPPALLRALLGGLTLAALYLCLFAVGRRGRAPGHQGLGLGDVKLAASLGQWLAWIGWTPLLVGAYLGLLSGGLSALALLLTGLARRDTALPHAPAMALGAVCALIFSE